MLGEKANQIVTTNFSLSVEKPLMKILSYHNLSIWYNSSWDDFIDCSCVYFANSSQIFSNG